MRRWIPPWWATMLGWAAWTSAACLLWARYHYIYQYVVRPAVPQWDGGFVALMGLGAALLVGLASGIIPAYRAAHLSVVHGLRKVV